MMNKKFVPYIRIIDSTRFHFDLRNSLGGISPRPSTCRSICSSQVPFSGVPRYMRCCSSRRPRERTVSSGAACARTALRENVVSRSVKQGDKSVDRRSADRPASGLFTNTLRRT